MLLDWDEANLAHVARHGVRPEEAEQVLRTRPLVAEVQYRSGERRVLCYGRTEKQRLLTVVFTERHGKTRVVTAFPMKRKLREAYEGRE